VVQQRTENGGVFSQMSRTKVLLYCHNHLHYADDDEAEEVAVKLNVCWKCRFLAAFYISLFVVSSLCIISLIMLSSNMTAAGHLIGFSLALMPFVSFTWFSFHTFLKQNLYFELNKSGINEAFM
jgi:hypothetical protein